MKPSDLRRHAQQTSVIANDLILAFMRRIKREDIGASDPILDALFQWRDRCRKLAERGESR
jgi:hypothetical protein